MPSVRVDRTVDGKNPLHPPSHSADHHPIQGMPMHIYPVANPYLPLQQPLRAKRRQVKNACTHCQKACKKCDDARPCLRCVKYGFSEECVDSKRKERKKGIKRGPYKKRDGIDCADSGIKHSDGSQQGVSVSNTPHPPVGSPPAPGPYMSVGYPPPGFYAQYSPESQPMYPGPQYYLTPVSPHIQTQLHGAPESDGPYPTQGFYPTTIVSSVPYHPQYSIPRSEGHVLPDQYTVYPGPVYHKEHSPHGLLNGGNVEEEGISGEVA